MTIGKSRTAKYYATPKGQVARKANHARYAAKHPDKMRANARERQRRYRLTEKGKAAMVATRSRQGDKARARSAVLEALRTGRLVKEPCSVCGAVPVHAHHHLGYEPDHWLDVRWLCPVHHAAEHRKTVREP